MTDLEVTALCAEALGWIHLGAVGVDPPKRGEPDPPGLWCLSGGNDWWINPEGHHVCAPCSGIPDPLHDDAQAMALVKKFRIQIDPYDDQWNVAIVGKSAALTEDLNRAICLCVARMQVR